VSRPFKWSDGSVTVALRPNERAALASMTSVVGSVRADPNDPARQRLTPPAYGNDDAADEEYRRLMAGELEAARSGDVSVFSATLASGRRRLDVAEAEAWLRVIGDARLVLAARRGVRLEDDDWESRVYEDAGLEIVAWLGWIQQELVETLTPSLGPPT